jgi:hypothetical protein
MEIKKIEDNKYAQIIEFFKLLSFILLLLTLILQLESFLFFLLKYIYNYILITIILFLIFHYLLIHYIIPSFLFFVQFPLFGKTAFTANGCSLAKEIKIYISKFIDICEKIIDNEKIIVSIEYINLLEIYERINIMIYIFYEMKKRYGLSKYQNEFYDKMVIWRKHFKVFKVEQYFKENKKHNDNSNNDILFNKNLLTLISDSNDIIKLLEDFLCNKYHFLSMKKIKNYFFNDTFSSENQYKTEFCLKFKEHFYTFITKDNKVIDYVIINNKKILNLSAIRNVTKFVEDKNINKNKENTIIKDKTEEESIITTISSLSSNMIEESFSSNTDINNGVIFGNNKEKKNLIIFCNPNSMIYQFFSPEKYFFYYQGGCDILFWNYRGYGQSDGFSTFDNVKKDILELYDEIKKLNIYEKIGVHGYSIGGTPATYLAKNRHIDLLVSDRNFSNLSGIVESYKLGTLLKFFCKFFLVDSDSDNINNYIFTKNENCIKIILCDPNDNVVLNNGSLKSGISRFLLKQAIKKENILDFFLNGSEKYVFIKALVNLEKFLDKNAENEKNLFIINLNDFFVIFTYGTEDLIKFNKFYYNRLKILCIDNFFNNFFVWGTRNKNNKEHKNKNNEFKKENNLYYIEKAIELLKSMENMKNNLSELIDTDNVLKDIKMTKDGFIRIRNLMGKININEDINKGYLIRLNCGHNSIISGKGEKLLVKILEKENFFK